MTTHSSILAWSSSWTEEPGGPQSLESQRIGHDLTTEGKNNLVWGQVNNNNTQKGSIIYILDVSVN